MKPGQVLPQILSACVLTAGLAACGGGSGATASPAPGTPAAQPAATSAPATAASSPAAPGSSGTMTAAEQMISANWATFFSAKTPVAKRVQLLQDGPAFAAVIKAQASSPLAAQATAKVTKVAVTGKSAAVTYSILESGTTALAGQKGTAVNSNGTWQVGAASFCGLLALENGGSTAGLPAACKSAG